MFAHVSPVAASDVWLGFPKHLQKVSKTFTLVTQFRDVFIYVLLSHVDFINEKFDGFVNLAKGTNEGKSFYVWKHSTSIDYLVFLSLP